MVVVDQVKERENDGEDERIFCARRFHEGEKVIYTNRGGGGGGGGGQIKLKKKERDKIRVTVRDLQTL